jgi:large subunit ribosomal protein L1
MAKRGKKIRDAYQGLDRTRYYPVEEAVRELKSRAFASFDEGFDVAMDLGVDPRHADQQVRGAVTLPNGTGKTIRVAVFAKGEKAEEAKNAGADVVGAEDLADQVKNGQIEFERCIATPDMMPVVGRLGKILGPRGLMPNPKLGTVTNDLQTAITDAKGGQVQFRVTRTGALHGGVGRRSFSEEALVENIRAFVDAVNRHRPSGAKGQYIKTVALSTSMGPGIKLDVNSVALADS